MTTEVDHDDQNCLYKKAKGSLVHVLAPACAGFDHFGS
jgi:hypothetical protein